MSSRFYLIPPTLVLAAICGVASPVVAGETKPLSPETCETVRRSSVGHPGKSPLLTASKRGATGCVRAKRTPLTLVSFVDVTGGKALVSGRTDSAIRQIDAGRTPPSAQELNNLCVAHTVQRRWDVAGDVCDAAVAGALARRANPGFRPRLEVDRNAAVAYSNRAVMHLLSHDVVAAQRDLANARAISPRAGFVVRNSDLAQDAPALAQNVVLVSDSMG